MVVVINLVSADVLRDTAGFTGYNIGFTNSIEKGGFAVVYMAKYANDRWSWFQQFTFINFRLFFDRLFLRLSLRCATVFNLKQIAMVFRNFLGSVLFNTLIH